MSDLFVCHPEHVNMLVFNRKHMPDSLSLSETSCRLCYEVGSVDVRMLVNKMVPCA